MPAVLRKILGSSTYFLICCGSELSHVTMPTYEKGWENVIFILDSHVPSQRPGDITPWKKSLPQCPISSHVTSLSLTGLQPRGFPLFLKQTQLVPTSRPLLLPVHLSGTPFLKRRGWFLIIQDSAPTSLPQRDLL